MPFFTLIMGGEWAYSRIFAFYARQLPYFEHIKGKEMKKWCICPRGVANWSWGGVIKDKADKNEEINPWGMWNTLKVWWL